MSRYTVSIDFETSENITEEEFEEWFKYAVIGWGGCSEDNPLIDEDKSDIVSNYDISKLW